MMRDGSKEGTGGDRFRRRAYEGGGGQSPEITGDELGRAGG